MYGSEIVEAKSRWSISPGCKCVVFILPPPGKFLFLICNGRQMVCMLFYSDNFLGSQ